MTTLTAGTQTPRRLHAVRRFGPAEWLFLAGTFVAPMDLLLVGSFTVYDFTLLTLFLIAIGGGRPLELPRYLLGPVLVFLGAALISTTRSVEPAESIEQLGQFAFIFFLQIPVIIAFVRSRRMLYGSLLAFGAGALVIAIVALAGGASTGAGRLLTFVSSNPNRLGYPSAFLLPMAALFVVVAWKRGRRALVVAGTTAALYLMVWALTASASRSAMVGLMVALVGLLVRRPRGWRQVLVGIALTMLALASVWVVVTQSGLFSENLRDRVERTIAGEEDLITDRSRLARAGLRAFIDSPLVGTGLDNFRHVATDFERRSTEQLPHNLWIQFLAQVGIIGTGAFFLMLIRWFRKMRDAHRHAAGPIERLEVRCLLASMASILAIFMFVPLMIQRHYWLLFGFGLVVMRTKPTWPSRSGDGLRSAGRDPVSRLGVLHVFMRVGATSAQYNEHCLPALGRRVVGVCTFFPSTLSPPPEMQLYPGDGTIRGFWRVLDAALSRPWDVIHFHAPPVGIIGVLMAIVRRRSLANATYTVHNSFQNYRVRNRLLLFPIVAAFGRTVLCSSAVKESLPRPLRWLGRGRMTVIPNAVDLSRVRSVARTVAWGATNGCFRVISVGRLIDIKDPLTLLRAFERSMAWPGRHADLEFIGDGSLRPRLLKEAREAGLQHGVRVTGLIARDEVYRHLFDASVFVSVSHGEGLPVAVLEAMATGRPVILSDIEPHREIVGDARFIPLVRPGDVEGFAAEIDRFYTLSRAELAHIGIACRRLVQERFSIDTMTEAYGRLYREVVRSARGAGAGDAGGE